MSSSSADMFLAVMKLPKWICAPTSSSTKITSAAKVGISDECRFRKVWTFAASFARGESCTAVLIR